VKRLKKKFFIAIAVMILTTAIYSAPAHAEYYSDYTTLYAGMHSSEVTNLQNNLKSLGYFNYSSTGYFGSITKQAVMNFQSNNGLSVDGIVGHKTASEIKVDLVLKTAKSNLGVPYSWGGASPTGFDCSGFTSYVLLKNGINVPRSAALQYNSGIAVSKSNLKPGDLVFFTTYKSGPSHVGIYLGRNQFIHASSGAGEITISDLNNPYFAPRYIGARRIIQ